MKNSVGIIEFKTLFKDYNLKNDQVIDNLTAMGAILNDVPKNKSIVLFQDGGNIEYSGIQTLYGKENYTLFNDSSWATRELDRIIVVDEDEYRRSLLCVTNQTSNVDDFVSGLEEKSRLYDQHLSNGEIRSIDTGLAFLIAPKASYYNDQSFERKLKNFMYYRIINSKS